MSKEIHNLSKFIHISPCQWLCITPWWGKMKWCVWSTWCSAWYIVSLWIMGIFILSPQLMRQVPHTPSLVVLMPSLVSSIRAFPKSFPMHFWCRNTNSQFSLSEGQCLRRQASSEEALTVGWIIPQFLKNLLCSCLFFLVCFETNISGTGGQGGQVDQFPDLYQGLPT